MAGSKPIKRKIKQRGKVRTKEAVVMGGSLLSTLRERISKQWGLE